ncbi:MAG TPA: PQQ-dependent sugar dehydrogenase [Acidobacteriota bacterium]|nr:PQQ-dependent sugar dehydrogenase [Acidobacteriota bacterium]
MAQVPPGFTDKLVAGPLDLPTACEFSPDGRLFILLKRGTVRIYKNGALVPTPALSIPVTDNSERGLLGIAFDPSFLSNRFVYLYYTTASSDPKNRVSRFTVNGDIIDRNSEAVILDGIRSDAGNHNAGWIQFGPDGKLYVATGDGGANSQLSQSLSSINGKILRINSNGSIPADNPFAGQQDRRGEIWCYGLRNPWRFTFDSTTGTMIIGDVGQNEFEEVDIGIRGANYGWPNAEGQSNNPNFRNPIFVYEHNGGSASITGGIRYRGDAFPEEYRGAYFYGDYVLGFIRYLKLNSSNTVVSDNAFAPNVGNVVHMTQGPDGALYYALIGQRQIRKIQFGSGNNSVPVVRTSTSRKFGPLPLTVNFFSTGTFDPDGDPLTFEWQFGDGTSATGRQTSHTYRNSQNFNARLTVTDSKGARVSSSVIKIFAGDRAPIPQILTPAAGTTVRPGQTIRFSGRATDPDEGTLSPANLTWTVVLHHNDHTHPFLGPLSGAASGQFTVSRNDHTDGNVFYRLRLKATDSRGLGIFKILDIPRE